MSFTDEERRQWHEDRRAGRHAEDSAPADPVCGHCGNQFRASAGVVTDDFSICDVCDGD
jgi:hypothetical protein